MTRLTKLLLIQNDHCSEPVRSTYGNTDQHFKTALFDTLQLRTVSLDVFPMCDTDGTQRPQNVEAYDGVIFSGSSTMLDEKKAWVERAMDLIRELLDQEKPMLGVCFGHQMLGAVCGAKVGPNPEGRMNGSALVTLNGAQSDALFGEFPSPFAVQISHRDVILESSPHFKILGSATHDPYQVIRAGKCAWGLQFHPEWTMEMSKSYVEMRRGILDKERGAGTADRLLSGLMPSSAATSILQRFANYCKK